MSLRRFVEDGYALIRGAYDKDLIAQCRKYVFDRFKKGKVQEQAVEIIESFQRTDLYDRFITNPKTLRLMQKLLGPDVCVLGYDALWINVPQDTDPVLLKGVHSDAWTGTGVDTIFAKVFFTDCDEYNGMSVCPGTHLQGMWPVMNRAVREMEPEAIPVMAKAGDLLIWHSLLLHSTTGHSDKNVRVSITSRYKSTETPFTSQERALGYRTLSVGPMNKIKRVIGNDYLTPFRTYGGVVGIDKRMAKIYVDSALKG